MFRTFRRDFSPKVNIIERLEFELAYYDVAIQHVSYDATMTSSLPV